MSVNVAVVTARHHSPGRPEKNLFELRGRPLLAYPVLAAQGSARVDRVYCSTDGEAIAAAAAEMGCEIVWRPEGVAGDVPHKVVIRHAVEEIAGRLGGLSALGSVVVLLGNTVMVDAALISAALAMLERERDIDGVLSAWRAQDDHPLRALEEGPDGLVRPYGGGPRDVDSNRQSYPPALFYDQGVWAFRAGCALREDGPSPWTWMGRRCRAIVREWVTGRDVHEELDVAAAEWWLDREGIPCRR